MAYARLGKKAEAVKAFDAIKDPKFAEIARALEDAAALSRRRRADGTPQRKEAPVACAPGASLRFAAWRDSHQPAGQPPRGGRRRSGLDVAASTAGRFRRASGRGRCRTRRSPRRLAAAGAARCRAACWRRPRPSRRPWPGPCWNASAALPYSPDAEEQLAHRDHLVAGLRGGERLVGAGQVLAVGVGAGAGTRQVGLGARRAIALNAPAPTPCSSTALASVGKPPRHERRGHLRDTRRALFSVFVSAISRYSARRSRSPWSRRAGCSAGLPSTWCAG